MPGLATFCGDCASLRCLAASACVAFFPNGAMVPGFAMFTADLPSRARLSASWAARSMFRPVGNGTGSDSWRCPNNVASTLAVCLCSAV